MKQAAEAKRIRDNYINHLINHHGYTKEQAENVFNTHLDKKTKGLTPHIIRFFIYDETIINDHDASEGDYTECEEEAFIAAEGLIEYERFTVFDNGAKQVCMTKNPFI